jgi:hypothetical protein
MNAVLPEYETNGIHFTVTFRDVIKLHSLNGVLFVN